MGDSEWNVVCILGVLTVYKDPYRWYVTVNTFIGLANTIIYD